MRILRLRSGQPVNLKYAEFNSLVCCSCGMSHDFVVEKRPGGYILTMWEDKKETKKERMKGGYPCRLSGK